MKQKLPVIFLISAILIGFSFWLGRWSATKPETNPRLEKGHVPRIPSPEVAGIVSNGVPNSDYSASTPASNSALEKGIFTELALTALTGIENREERGFRTDQVLQHFGFDDTLEALKVTGEWPLSHRNEELREALWKRLGAIDGIRAIEQLKGRSLAEVDAARGAVIVGWAESNPDSAWDWVSVQQNNHGMLAAYTAALMREGAYALAVNVGIKPVR